MWRFLTRQAAGGGNVPVGKTQTSEGRQLQEVFVVEEQPQPISDQQLPVFLSVSEGGALSSTFLHPLTELHVPFKVTARVRERRGCGLNVILTYFWEQALLFRRLASYTCCWMGRSGCCSTGKALRRALLLRAGKLRQRTERWRGCSASLQTQHHQTEAPQVTGG